MESVAAWVSAVAVAMSAVFTALTWHRSNLSKSAREAADEAEQKATRKVDAAEKQVDAVEKQAAELRRLTEKLSGPSLVAQSSNGRGGGAHISLRNTTDESVKVAEIANREEFFLLELPDGDVPFTIPAGAQVRMLAQTAAGMPMPANFHLRVDDGDIHVPIDHY